MSLNPLAILRTAASAVFILVGVVLTAQTSSQKAAVPLNATVQSSPARITLSWTTLPSTTSITIYRKLLDATTWGSAIATPAASDLTYTDNSVSVGTAYEYKVVRVAAGVTGTGYIASGIAVPPVDYRGRMILLVDNTFSSALSSELATLVQDLRMDGWAVARTDMPRTASVATVKSTILSQYNTDPLNTKAVFIVGHLAVPYSGNQAPDGHSEHTGAWPCDGYYGELNGNWTDNSVNNSGSQRTANRNIPGDGKFDQSDFPSPLELQVGRVDFYDMPAFSLNETELLRNYLNKSHNFKVKQWAPQQRGLVYDNLQWVSNPLAACAWRSIPPLVGNSQTTAAAHLSAEYTQFVNNQSYLWTYYSGGGVQATTQGELTYNGAARCGTTEYWASSMSSGGVFNMSFGSYFGDWDNKNNFLRAPLASGQVLTNCWAAIPAWYFHHMGMGANIGYSTLVTMNNNSLYTPLTDGWQGSIGRGHLALMGDPSLRQKMILPPTNLTVTNSGGYASFTWIASGETVDGYHLYTIDASTGAITRITALPVTGTSHVSTTAPFVSGRQYMVRAVKLTTEPSGSYYNLSLGASVVAAGTTVDCNGVVGGSATPGTACNDGNACTINDTWNANCQCTGTLVSLSAAITPSGPTTFCSGSTVTLQANTGTGLTYQWRRNGTNLSGATASAYTATTAGTYTVVITNSGCSATSSGVVVTVNAAPTATITAGGSTTFCAGGSVALSANTGTGLTYQWRNNGTNISGATASTYSASSSGSYTVVVTSSGCSTTSSAVSVTANAAPAATITAGGATSFCSGGSVALSASTGTGYTYQWRNNGTNISGATAATYTASAAGTYSVVVTSSGCSATSTGTTVTVGTAPTAAITAGGATTFCSGSSVSLSANTGTGLTYQWRSNGTNISGATASTYSASTSGSYTVVVTSSGCSTTSSAVNVTATAAPAATITAAGATSFCSGGSVVLSANTGTGLSYQWRRNGTNLSGATSATFTAGTAGTYTVVVSNGTCSTTSAGTAITVSSAPAAAITAGGATTFCSGGSVGLSANSGTGLTYQWRNNGSNISGATAASHSATASGSYTVVVTSGGCSTTSSTVGVTVNAAPTATITAGGSTSFCTGGSVVLSANTGTGLTYQWRNNGTNISGATSSSYTATVGGSYTVVVSNSTCSTTSAATTVASGSAPTATITAGGATTFCSGGSVALSANTGTGLTYQWRRNGTNISGATTSSYPATLSGSYTVVVTSNGCSTTSAAVTVTANAAPTATITANGSTSLCSGGNVTLSATTGTGLTYQWRNNGTNISGATTSSYTTAAAGSYTVVVSNGTCSTTSAATTVSTGSAPTLTCSSNTSTSTVSVTATGGQSPYTYSWSTTPAQTGATATVSASGTYTVTVTGANGCSSTCSTSIALSTSSTACSGLRTEAQGTWGANPTQYNLAGFMSSNWAAAFPTANGLTIGCGSRIMRFTTAAAIKDALPTYGTPALLPAGTSVNPGATLSNTLVGQIASLALNIRFDELFPSFAPSNHLLKNMVIASGTFAGLTVQQLLDLANQHAGGCASTYPLATVSQALINLNNGYQAAAMNNGYLTCPPQGMILEEPMPGSEELSEMSVLVAPNPTRGSTSIVLPATDDDAALHVELRSATGALVAVLANGKTETGTPKRIDWDASGLPSGIYICIAQVGDRLLHARVVVQ